jgi:hypothetical protein
MYLKIKQKLNIANESARTPNHPHPLKKNFRCAPAHPGTGGSAALFHNTILPRFSTPQNTAFIIILRHAVMDMGGDEVGFATQDTCHNRHACMRNCIH